MEKTHKQYRIEREFFEATGRGLVDYVREARDEGRSWRSLERDLDSRDLYVSNVSLAKWYGHLDDKANA